MASENDLSKGKCENDGPARDRLDWITKYLELADKIIQAHMPGTSTQPEER